jgi:magnesium-transporting ATPase (P-type)
VLAAKGASASMEVGRPTAIAEVPFDPTHKFMAIPPDDRDRQPWCLVKGAPDVLTAAARSGYRTANC